MRTLSSIAILVATVSVAGGCASAESATDEVAAPSPKRGGRTAAEWAALAEEADPDTRQLVAVNLAGFGPEALPYAREWMDAPDAATRYLGAEVARLVAPESKGLVPTLRALCHDTTPEVRRAAVRAIGAIGCEAAQAVPDVGRLLDDEDWTIRRHAARTLGVLGRHAVPHLDALEHRSRHDLDRRVRQACAEAYDRVWEAWHVWSRHQFLRR